MKIKLANTHSMFIPIYSNALPLNVEVLEGCSSTYTQVDNNVGMVLISKKTHLYIRETCKKKKK